MTAKSIFVISLVITLCFVLFSCTDPAKAQDRSSRNLPWLPFTIKNAVPPMKSEAALHHKIRPRSPQSTMIDSTTFTLYPADLTGVLCGDAVWIDYDNDGDLDILVSGMADTIPITKIYRNDNGVFTDIQANIPGMVSEHGVAWGDYDNDGDFDLAIEGNLANDSAHAVPITKIYRNDNGTFVDINAPIIQVMGGSVTWIDYDGDGRLDLLVTGAQIYGSEFASKLYHNDGDGIFSEAPISLPGVWASSVGWADFNNDGSPDLLITGYGNWGVTTALFQNNCWHDTVTSFTHLSPPLQRLNSCGIAWGDYDNDGFLDLVFSGDPPTWTWNTFSTIYHNNGDGTFTDIQPGLDSVMTSAVAWGDYDNDGLLDLALSGWFDDSTNITKIYHNDGGGKFSDIHAALPGVWFGSLAWGDFDNDGRLDLLMSGGTAPQMYYNAHPPFQPITQIYHNNLIVASNKSPITPPTAASSVHGNAVQFTWDQTTDDHTPLHGLTYNLRVGTSPGASDVFAPSSNVSTGYRRIPRIGSTGNHLTKTLYLPTGTYYWGVQAVDNGYAGSQFTDEKKFVIGIPQAISSWYMVSVPYAHDGMTRADLFPNAISYAFSYNTSYQLADTLEAGVGYWLKYAAGTTPEILDGTGISTLSIPVREGWNMIGSISSPVSTSSIISDPPGMTTSSFFTYNGTYQRSNTIGPGAGYWVKVNEAGTLTLSASAVVGAGTIRIVENNEAPPSPPEGNDGSKKNILPSAFGLEQNFPNPFNPSTSIRYLLPADSRVVLKVYNLLGQVVATLVNGLQTAGTKEARWDAGSFSSGIYFYRMEATNVTNLHDGYLQTGKMLLLK